MAAQTRPNPDSEIVVGVDGSPASTTALRWAAAQARLTGARLHLVTAWEYPTLYGWTPGDHYEDFALTAGKALLVSTQEILGPESDVAVEETVVAGHPAQVLIDASKHAALLVIGSHGHGRFAGTLIGSVSLQCVQHASCPVVVVRGRG